MKPRRGLERAIGVNGAVARDDLDRGMEHVQDAVIELDARWADIFLSQTGDQIARQDECLLSIETNVDRGGFGPRDPGGRSSHEVTVIERDG
jgi:hypothetical protein